MIDQKNEIVKSGENNFYFEGEDQLWHRVRCFVGKDGEPWFVANDVAKALGYASPANAIQDHCKYAKIHKVDDLPTLTESPYGIKVIPVSDLYCLITWSNLPGVEKFLDGLGL